VSILNERESAIMTYKAQGLTSKEIAKLLNLEFRTIDTYFGQIKKKLRARNTAHAIYLAFEGGVAIEK
jgi:DNA-binding NarL/FixJ family response regulator